MNHFLQLIDSQPVGWGPKVGHKGIAIDPQIISNDLYEKINFILNNGLIYLFSGLFLQPCFEGKQIGIGTAEIIENSPPAQRMLLAKLAIQLGKSFHTRL